MRRGRGLVCAGAAAFAMLLAPLPQPVTATVLCSTPSVTAVAPATAAPGTTVTISGSGFGSCAFAVSVGGVAVPASRQGDGSAQFTAQPGAAGGVTVQVSDGVGGSNASNGNVAFYPTPTVHSLSTASPTEGSSIAVSGGGLSLGGHVTALAAVYSVGGGPCQTTSGRVQSDGAATVPAPSTYCSGPLQLQLTAPGDLANPSGAQVTVAVGAGSVTVAPVVASLTPAHAVPGTTVTVTGSGFGGDGTAALAGVVAASTWQDHAVQVAVPDAASSGALTLTRGDGASIGVGTLTVESRVDTVSPVVASPGDTVTIAGAGFGTRPGTVSAGGTPLTVQSWSPDSVVATVPAGASSGPVTVVPAVNTASAPGPVLSVLARIASVSPGHGAAGTLVQVAGSGFGTRPGTVTIGGRPGQVTLWSDAEVLVTVPAGLTPGAGTLAIAVPGAVRAVSVAFAVDAGAAPTPGASPPPVPPSPHGPIVGAHVPFSKPAPPPGPVHLTLSMDRLLGDPGGSVSFTVTLTAYGRPVAGAPVDLVMVVEPGRDASLTPASAVTDAAGRVRGVLHLSRTPGDHIVLARSGAYSDETRVVGRGVETAAGGAVGGSAGPVLDAVRRTPVLAALGGCVLVFGLGFGINVATRPGGEALELAGGLTRRRFRRGRIGMRLGGSGAAASAVRFGAGMLACAAALSVGLLRRG